MAKVNQITIKPWERDKYPNLKTKSELKKMKLMPKQRVKPRAILEVYHFKKYEYFDLYDVDLTVGYKATEEERKKLNEKQRRYNQAKREKQLKEKRLNELKLTVKPHQKVIFDVETTGLDPKKDEIIQFSAINEKNEILLNTYIKPIKNKSWVKAELIHGISPEMVKDCKSILDYDLWEKIQSIFLSASELIAYNGNFDIGFLEASGIEIPKIDYYDVMLAFAPIYGEWSDRMGDYKWQKLSTCASYYGFDFNAHDSLEDVRATLFCYLKLTESE